MNDILIGGDTLLVEAGVLPGELFADRLPGELFADRPGRLPLRLGSLHAKEELVVQATYVGPLSSASLSYEVFVTEVPAGDVPADSAFLPMSSDVPIFSGAQVQGLVSVPRGYGFLPEEVLLRDPEKWVVRDVRIGNMSLFAKSGDAPGTLFGARTRGCQLNFSAACFGGSTNFNLHVRYVGPNTNGEPLICGVAGRVVCLPSH